MYARSRFSSGYMLSGIWVFMATAVTFFGFTERVQAQVDNIQTQAIISAPPVAPITPNPTGIAVSPKEFKVFGGRVAFYSPLNPPPGACPFTDKQIAGHAQKVWDQMSELRAERGPSLDLSSLLDTNPERARAFVLDFLKKAQKAQKKRVVVQPPKWTYCRGQPTSVKASLIFNPTYETDALKTGSNRRR